MAFRCFPALTLFVLADLLLLHWPPVVSTECPSNRACNITCSYGFQKDENECDVCKCDDPCKNVSCGEQFKCVIVEFSGTKYQTCMKSPECVPPTCRMACPFGFAIDEDGCEVCACRGDPCRNVTCSIGFECDPVKRDGIFVGSCYPATTSDCKSEECDVVCDFGMAKDEFGCDICECALPCKAVNCSQGLQCVPQRQNDSKEYVGKCLPKGNCPVRDCDEPCLYGNLKDNSGCNMCACLDPCQDMTCEAGYRCLPSLEGGSSDGSDGDYVGKCTAINNADCPNMPCQLLCPYGKVKDSNNCDMCTCVDPCYGVSCEDGNVCVPRRINDTNTFQPICIPDGCVDPSCPTSCVFGYVKNEQGCDTCDCLPDPCMLANCNSSQKCVTEKFSGAGNYKTRCMPRENCMQRTCGKTCDYGFTRDEYNCETCNCSDPCKGFICNLGSKCVPQRISNTSRFEPRCAVECPQVLCLVGCPFGYARDERGCPGCTCLADPCTLISCNSSQKCITENSTGARCIPREVICPKIMCAIWCDFGYLLDSSGCDSCRCRPNPCLNVTCSSDSTCIPVRRNNSLLYDGQCTIRGPCSHAECRYVCEYGGRELASSVTSMCSSCQCRNPCMDVDCLGNQCLLNTSKYCLGDMCHSIKQASCSVIKCPERKCPASCLSGFKKDGFGCQTCECVDVCESLKCRVNEYCKAEEPVCQPCNLHSCTEICLYGTVNCNSCECVEDPCSSATCHPSQECRPIYSPYRHSGLNYLCVDNTSTSCLDLQNFYSTSPLSPDKDIQLNCDSNNHFKPLQCHGDVCWCVQSNGKSYAHSSLDSLETLNCGKYNYMIEDSVRIEMDYKFVNYTLQWDLKKQISQQLAELLLVRDREVVITRLSPGSVIANFIILCTNEEKFFFVEESLKELRKEGSFKLAYNEMFYLANLYNDSNENSPTDTPPRRQDGDEERKKFYALVILVPIVLVLLVVLVIFLIGFCITKYLKLNQRSMRGMSLSKQPISDSFNTTDEADDVFCVKNGFPGEKSISLA